MLKFEIQNRLINYYDVLPRESSVLGSFASTAAVCDS
ncbi:hypothetical protein BH24CHL4_BH24CHL4_07110 [soil metagenome]